MERAVEEGKEVKVLDTNASWYGITYREDLESVRNAINKCLESYNYLFKFDVSVNNCMVLSVLDCTEIQIVSTLLREERRIAIAFSPFPMERPRSFHSSNVRSTGAPHCSL